MPLTHKEDRTLAIQPTKRRVFEYDTIFVDYYYDKTGVPYNPEVVYGILTSDPNSERTQFLSQAGDGFISEEGHRTPFSPVSLVEVQKALDARELDEYCSVFAEFRLPHMELCFMLELAAMEHYVVCPSRWQDLKPGHLVKVRHNWFVVVRIGVAFITLAPSECINRDEFDVPELPEWAKGNAATYRR